MVDKPRLKPAKDKAPALLQLVCVAYAIVKDVKMSVPHFKLDQCMPNNSCSQYIQEMVPLEVVLTSQSQFLIQWPKFCVM